MQYHVETSGIASPLLSAARRKRVFHFREARSMTHQVFRRVRNTRAADTPAQPDNPPGKPAPPPRPEDVPPRPGRLPDEPMAPPPDAPHSPPSPSEPPVWS